MVNVMSYKRWQRQGKKGWDIMVGCWKSTLEGRLDGNDPRHKRSARRRIKEVKNGTHTHDRQEAKRQLRNEEYE